NRATLPGLAVEALLDQAGVELHDLLDRHRDLVRPQLPAHWLAVDSRLLEQPRAEPDALANDGDFGVEVVAPAGADADDAAVLGDESVHHRLRHHHCARLVRLLGEPGIEASAEHRVGMRMLAVA